MYLADKDILNLLDDLESNINKLNPGSVKDAVIFTKKLIEDIIRSFSNKKRSKFKLNSENINKPELGKILEKKGETPTYLTIGHILMMLELVLVGYNSNMDKNPISTLDNNIPLRETVIIIIDNIINQINTIIKNNNGTYKLIGRI